MGRPRSTRTTIARTCCRSSKRANRRVRRRSWRPSQKNVRGNVVDLMERLRQSLEGTAGATDGRAAKPVGRKSRAVRHEGCPARRNPSELREAGRLNRQVHVAEPQGAPSPSTDTGGAQVGHARRFLDSGSRARDLPARPRGAQCRETPYVVAGRLRDLRAHRDLPEDEGPGSVLRAASVVPAARALRDAGSSRDWRTRTGSPRRRSATTSSI